MSIDRTRRGGRVVAYIARPPDGRGGKLPGREFDRLEDARAWHDQVVRARRLGPGTLAQALGTTPTLGAYIADTWLPQHVDRLAPRSQLTYRRALRHIEPLTDIPLGDLNAATIRVWLTDLADAEHGPTSILASFKRLRQILKHALQADIIGRNPTDAVQAPRVPPPGKVDPLDPETVERIRAELDERDRTIVSVLAYAGLRPAEAFALTWGNVLHQVLDVRHDTDGIGGLRGTKTGKHREVDLLAPLRDDLAAWRATCGRPADRRLLFPSEHTGGPFTADQQSAWRKDRWSPAVRAAAARHARHTGAEPDAPLGTGPVTTRGRDAARDIGIDLDGRPPHPYACRHSFVSMLVGAGHPVTEVALQAGHRVSETQDRYAHVIRRWKGHDRVDPAERIAEARALVANLAEDSASYPPVRTVNQD